jgi:hypothetical protein
MKKPGGTHVRLLGDNEADTHYATVRDRLSEQFTAAYETQRPDGGWTEHVVFCFYRDKGLTWEDWSGPIE